MLGACSRATSSLLHPVQNAREFVTGGWGHECKDHCGQGEGGVAEEGADQGEEWQSRKKEGIPGPDPPATLRTGQLFTE